MANGHLVLAKNTGKQLFTKENGCSFMFKKTKACLHEENRLVVVASSGIEPLS
jgi:hypothetical protein